MSALAGVVQPQGAVLQPDELRCLCEVQSRHGGDAQGVWQGAGAAFAAQLRHFTPQDRFERQPRVSLDGRWVLVWDGRLDNRDALGDELQLHVSDELADSELVLAAWQCWEEAAWNRLAGAFALALWDTRQRRLQLVRSPVCGPVLFHTCHAGRFAFATTPRAVLQLAGLPCALNERKLADMLIQSPAAAEETLYQGVQRLPTGCVLTWDAQGGVQLQRYWQPALDRLHLTRDDDYLQAWRALLDQVLSSQLRTNGRAGAFVSSGLDSSAIAVAAARLLGPGHVLPCYTSVPWLSVRTPLPPPYYADERDIVLRIAAGQTGLQPHFEAAAGRDFLHELDDSFDWNERYVPNTANRVWLEAIYRRAHDEGLNVLLTGAQGNLAFSRSGTVQPLPWHSPAAWMRWLRHSGWWRGRGLRRRQPPSAPQRVATQVSLSPVRPGFLQRHAAVERATDVMAEEMRADSADPRLPLLRALNLQDISVFDTSVRGRFGVDLRNPACDRRLVEFCLSLPEEQHCFHGQDRALVRRAMRGELPSEVLDQRGRGMQAADWFERQCLMRDRLQHELDRMDASDCCREVLDLDRLHHLLHQWPEPSRPLGELLPWSHVLERGLVIGRFLLWLEEKD